MSAHAALRAVFDDFARTDALAYRHVDGDLSFKTLRLAALSLAQRLAGDDTGPVLILGHKHRRVLIAYWACLLSGRAAVPVELGTTPERLALIAATSGATRALIADAETPVASVAGLPTWPVAEECGAPGRVYMDYCTLGPKPSLPQDIEDTRCAYILFSSGTTGQPKGIAVSYGNLRDFVGWAGRLLGDGPAPRCISGNVRYCFDVSLFEMWFSWLSLRPISALDHRELFNTALLIDRYRSHRLSTWVSTPALALHWIKDRRFRAETLPDLRSMLFCGEVLSRSLVEALWSRFPDLRIVNTYGPTECTVAVTSVEITKAHLRDPRGLPIGRVRAGTALQAGEDGSGEIVITGQSVGLGYLGDPAKQARAFPGAGTYRTGDWGTREGDLWYFEGRKDREIKLNGHRIDLNTVEAALRAVKGVDDAVVDCHPNGRGLRAFVLGPGGEADLRALARRAGPSLAAYMQPRFWYGAASFPLNNNSKLDRGRFVADLERGRPVIVTDTRVTPDAAAPVAAG